MESCNRCGGADDLRPLHRFPDEKVEGGPVTEVEVVCSGCCTRVELNLGRRIPEDDPELMAFVLALADSVDHLHDAFSARKAIYG